MYLHGQPETKISKNPFPREHCEQLLQEALVLDVDFSLTFLQVKRVSFTFVSFMYK